MTVLDDLSARAVSTVCQTIVRLDTGTVFGAEALSRDASGGLAMTSLSETARHRGALTELDQWCRSQALRAWLTADILAGCSTVLREAQTRLTPPSRIGREPDGTTGVRGSLR